MEDLLNMTYLTPNQMKTYARLCPLAELARVRIHQVRWLPNRAGAMTLRNHILFRETRDDPSYLMAHELVHVRQFAEQGTARFLFIYVVDYLGGLVKFRNHRLAYLNIGFESAARAEVDHWARRHG